MSSRSQSRSAPLVSRWCWHSAARWSDSSVSQLLGILALVLPLAVAIAAVGGYVLAYRALRPVELLRRAAEDYGAKDLSRRLAPRELRDDELGRLARTLDAMLDRVAAA